MTWWIRKEKGVEDVDLKKGIDALGSPCLWYFFKLECPLCQRAAELYRKYDMTKDEKVKQKAQSVYAKRTPMAFAIFSSEHEDLQHLKNKPVVIVLPIDHVVGAISNRLVSKEWEGDPTDIENGYIVTIWRKYKQGERFANWYVKRGKPLPLTKEKVKTLYKKLALPNPKQDKGAFLNWLYNKHPELVVVSWADIPADTEVDLRILPWPWKTASGEYIPENEVDQEASPFKVMRFHWRLGEDVVGRLKEAEFDISRFNPSKEEEDIPLSSESGDLLDEV